MTRTALRQGLIQRLPCFICGDPKSEAHHPDYQLPLAVAWLCRKHHQEIHLATGDARQGGRPSIGAKAKIQVSARIDEDVLKEVLRWGDGRVSHGLERMAKEYLRLHG